MRSDTSNPVRHLRLAAALALSLGACAPHRSVDGFPGLASGGATVTVYNQHASDMKVYVLAGSAEHRLGLVTAMSSATFRIPQVIPNPAELSFRAVPLAMGEAQSTEAITVFSTNSIAFTIGQNATSTNLVLRR